MKITVVGSGYVGLVVAACMAESGNDVIGADIDEAKIDGLNRGEVPIVEPGLAPMLERNIAADRLRFTSDIREAVRASDLIFLAVGTPPGKDHAADLSAVVSTARLIGEVMNGEKIVVTKSTVPVGTARLVRSEIEARTDHPVHVCANPEFLKEGAAVGDFMAPDRVVIGSDSAHATAILRDLYAPFVRTGRALLVMDVRSAEITKYACNAMLAVRISLMNSIARLCDATGADVRSVRRGVGSDSRIGRRFLYPGVGYGGSCLPKDMRALARTMSDRGVDPSILDAAESINQRQKRLLLVRLIDRFGEDLGGRTIAVWGLAFKPNTDDMREAPSIVTIEGLLERGARVVGHDPEALTTARAVFGDRIEYVADNYQALEGADALLIHTEWYPYRRLDIARVRAAMRTPVILDGRNLYDPRAMEASGFEYRCVGRTVQQVPSP